MCIMMKYSNLIAVLIILLIPCVITAQSNNKTAQFIENDTPKYVNEEFISLEELYTINVDEFVEYYIYKVNTMEVDDDLNLYVIDSYEQTVTVFDKDGKYIKTMGRKGQGPNELYNCISLSIHNNKIYLHEAHRGIKVWDMQEKYIDYFRYKAMMGNNYDFFKAFDDYYLTVNYRLLDRNNNREFVIEKHSLDLKSKTAIWKVPYKDEIIGLFAPEKYLALDSKKNFYFPESYDKYRISKITFDGKLMFTFGRKYKRIPYSEKVRKWLEEWYSLSNRKPPSKLRYPPIVRCIFVDDYDYIWVVVGECLHDSATRFQVESTIDIFNDKGEYLYTFKSPFLWSRGIMKNGRIYSLPTEDDLNIHVFKINYNY